MKALYMMPDEVPLVKNSLTTSINILSDEVYLLRFQESTKGKDLSEEIEIKMKEISRLEKLLSYLESE